MSSVVVFTLTPNISFVSGVAAGAAAGFVAGFSMSAFSGGSLSDSFKAGLNGALSGAVFGGIGSAGLGDVAGVAAHAVAGGVLSELQGGKFGHGFISAGLTKFASLKWISQIKGTDWGHIFGRTAIASTVGGTISKLTGGKFSNGAQTAAFAHLFNQESKALQSKIQSAHRMASVKRIYGDILKAGNIDLDKNMKAAVSMDLAELKAALTDKLVWNYKRNSALISALKNTGKYDAELLAEFGNVHAGMVYGAAGIRLDFALAAGGGYQAFSQNVRNDNFSIGSAMSSASGIYAWFTGMTYTTRQTIRWADAGFTWGDNNDDIWPIIQGYCATDSSCD